MMIEFWKDSFGLGFKLTYKKMDKELSTLMGIQWHLHPHKVLLEAIKHRKNPINAKN